MQDNRKDGERQVGLQVRGEQLLVGCQSGFWLGKSTMDSVLVLDMDVRRALAKNEAFVASFLDI